MKKTIIAAFEEGWLTVATLGIATAAILYPFTQDSEKLWEFEIAMGTLQLACATMWLAIKTGKLAQSSDAASEKSIEQMKVAAEAAKKSADAAELSAQAAIGVELPSLHVLKVETGAIKIEDWHEGFYPVITMENYGRTPAFVSEIIINSKMGIGLPKLPVYEALEEFPKPFVIDAKKTHTQTAYFMNEKYKYTQEQFREVQEEDGWLYIYGIIKYKDFLDTEHHRGFCYLYIPRNRRFIPSSIHNNYSFQKIIKDSAPA